MIFSCPICGKDAGVTHGDQLFKKQVCDECRAWQEEQDKEKVNERPK